MRLRTFLLVAIVFPALCCLAGEASKSRPPRLRINGVSFSPLKLVKRDAYNLYLEIASSGKDRAERLRVAFGIQDAENHYELVLGGDRQVLIRRVNGREAILAVSSAPLFISAEGADSQEQSHGREAKEVRTADAPHGSNSAGQDRSVSVTIKRRPSWLSVVIGREAALSVLDSTFGAGAAAVQTAAARDLLSFKVQPVAEIEFSDDFMRTERTAVGGPWAAVSGSWELLSHADQWRSYSPMVEENVTRSANPFVYRGSSTERAIALAGYDFWDDYTFEASVKGEGGSPGLAVHYRGADDYFAFRIRTADRPDAAGYAELVRVTADGEELLGKTGIIARKGVWYRVSVSTLNGEIQVAVDGAPILRSRSRGLSGGRIGLVAEGGATDFDDVLVRSTDAYIFRDEASFGGSARGGDWRFRDEDGSRLLWPPDANQSVLLFGDPKWKKYNLDLKLRQGESESAAGVLFGARGLGEFFRLVWRTRDELTLEKVHGGESSVLATVSCPFEPNNWRRIRLDLTDEGVVKAYIDGKLELRTSVPEIPPGQPGLYAKGSGVAFSAPAVRFSWHEDVERVIENDIFQKDTYMVEWAAARGDWVEAEHAAGQGGEHIYWHKGDFYGPFSVAFPLGKKFTLLFGAAKERPRAGYTLEVSARSVALRDASRELCKAEPDQTKKPSSLTLHRDGSYLWLEQDGSALFSIITRQARLPIAADGNESRLPGTRVAAVIEGDEPPTFLNVKRWHVADYQFDKAAVDWLPVGRWEVSNKFACDPRWSFMAGEADGLAALWHKAEFEGDLTVEFYAAMRYLQKNFGRSPYYQRPGEINLTIASNGKEVFDGYTFVLSGWDTHWTRVLRNGKIVAETDRPLVPSTRWKYPRPEELHRRWFYVKVRKLGNRLEYYFDNQLVLTYDDPDPLQGRRLALWTRDNSIIVARAKISYEKKRLRVITCDPPPEPETPPLELQINSETHPGILCDFENSVNGWENPSGDQGALLEVDDSTASSGRSSLKLTNAYSGGDFAARLPIQSIDLANVTEFSFDYRITEGVKINFYFELFKKLHFIELTASGESNENMKRVGAIPVNTDGHWRHAELPLAQALRDIYPEQTKLVATRLTFGNLREGYLHAGLGGNHAGASYHLDNFRVVSSGGDPRFFIAAPDKKPLELAYLVDRAPNTVPGDFSPSTPWLQLNDLAPGLWYLHARGRADDGKLTVPAHLCFEVDTAPLGIEGIEPEPGADWGGEVIRIQITPKGGERLDVQKLSLMARDTSFDISSPALSYNGAGSELRFDVGATTLDFDDGEEISFRLTANRTGVDQPLEREWRYRWRFDKDKTGPPAPEIENYHVNDTFERGLGECGSAGPDSRGRPRDALLVRDDTTAAEGRYCLKLFNEVMGGAFGATVTTRTFHAGAYPLLLFDYRVDRGDVFFDLGVWAGGRQRRIRITDNDHRNSLDVIGEVSDCRADGKWHSAMVNLRRMLETQDYSLNMYEVTKVAFGDWGWQGNREGAVYRIDNFRIIPAMNPKKGFSVSWRAGDPSGIRGYSLCWSVRPDKEPDKTIESELSSARFVGENSLPEDILAAANGGEHDVYFHIRAQDSAGNWGPPGHYLFLVDTEPPRLGAPTPANGAKSGGSRFSMRVRDDVSGVDPQSLWFTVNGRFYQPGSAGVTYTPSTGELCWDWRKAADFRGGGQAPEKFTVQMKAPRDFAGNIAKPLQWSWTFDSALDHTPPLINSLTCHGQPRWTFETFSEGFGKVVAWGAGTRLKRVWDDERKDYCARAVCYAEASGYGVRLANNYDSSIYPYVDFDYKFPPNLKLQLVAYVNHENPERRMLVVKLTKGNIRPDYVVRIGEVPGVKCDNQWHHLSFNLYELIDANEPEKTGYQINHLILQDIGFNWHKAGTTLYLDNVCISGAGGSTAQFEWQAIDESGIRDYAFCMDEQFATDPPPESTTTQSSAVIENESSGLRYFHLRARDGAGNWSKTLHYPYWVGGD